MKLQNMRENIINVCLFIMCLFMTVSMVAFLIYAVRSERVYAVNDVMAKNNIEIIKINNCEYLKFPVNGSMYSFSHKGDCSNPIHQHNLEKAKQ